MDKCTQILVVEDNKDIREAIIEALGDEGYVVDSASDGREGLKKLTAAKTPTLVFLDLMMPTMNGWEFLDAFKAQPNPLNHKIVTVSAVNATQSLNDRTPLKTDGSITKPIQLEKLWDEVNSFCTTPIK